MEGPCGAHGTLCLKEPVKKDPQERGEKDRPFLCAVIERKSGEENEGWMRAW
jgi:hypothetical protein